MGCGRVGSSLARQLGRLCADDELRAETGRQSRAMFDAHLDHREMLDRYAAVVLAAARQGPRANSPPEPVPLPGRRAA